MTALTLAAANPQAEVHGIDFMPEHVELSNRMAAQAGLANAHFHALSFAQGLEKDLPMFDYIVAHGVYSWVTGDVRAEVVEFIRRFLAPGGIAYISYNTMPGHAQTAPVQKLVSHFGKSGTGESSARVLQAFEFVKKLHAMHAPALVDKPVVDMLLHSVAGSTRVIWPMNTCTPPGSRYFIDVAAEMAKADLTYVGTATLFAADERFTVGPDHKALLDALPTRVEREFIKDYLLDANFRRDVYSRGARVLTPQERDAELGKRAFALRVNASAVNYICQVGLAEVGIESPAAHAIINALAAG
ncbi:MAG: methyltransferase domain-containing protein [Burkholderiales bacterium]|nr:methyltransferase domain-containing protein [Burkholderiales bacterium]